MYYFFLVAPKILIGKIVSDVGEAVKKAEQIKTLAEKFSPSISAENGIFRY